MYQETGRICRLQYILPLVLLHHLLSGHRQHLNWPLEEDEERIFCSTPHSHTEDYDQQGRRIGPFLKLLEPMPKVITTQHQLYRRNTAPARLQRPLTHPIGPRFTPAEEALLLNAEESLRDLFKEIHGTTHVSSVEEKDIGH